MSWAYNIPFKVEKTDQEEAMYKEMFKAIVSGNGAEIDIVDDEATTINGPVLWGALGVHSIHMANAVSTATSGGDSSLLRVIDNAGTGSSKNLVSVYLPKFAGGLHSFCFHMGSKIQSITLGDFSVPGSYTSLYNCSSLTSFTVAKTADAMLALITSNKVINIPSACVFHCNDAKKIVKSGSSWVIQDE